MPPSITPFSGPNNIDYICNFPQVIQPYFSLRPINSNSQWYNIGYAPVDATGKATSFTFNPSNFINANKYPSTLPIPPAPGVYKLVLNSGSGGSSVNIIYGTVNLQGNNILPVSGGLDARFTIGFKNTLDPIAQAQRYYARYNDNSAKISLYADRITQNLNNFSFLVSENDIQLVGTYKVYTFTNDEYIDSFVIDTNPNIVSIDTVLVSGNDAGQQAITNLSSIETPVIRSNSDLEIAPASGHIIKTNGWVLPNVGVYRDSLGPDAGNGNGTGWIGSIGDIQYGGNFISKTTLILSNTNPKFGDITLSPGVYIVYARISIYSTLKPTCTSQGIVILEDPGAAIVTSNVHMGTSGSNAPYGESVIYSYETCTVYSCYEQRRLDIYINMVYSGGNVLAHDRNLITATRIA